MPSTEVTFWMPCGRVSAKAATDIAKATIIDTGLLGIGLLLGTSNPDYSRSSDGWIRFRIEQVEQILLVLLQMKIVSVITSSLLFTGGITSSAAETLQDALRAAN